MQTQAPGILAAEELAASGALGGLFAQIDAGELDLTGDGGFNPALIKTTLERGLAAEHLSLAVWQGETCLLGDCNATTGTS